MRTKYKPFFGFSSPPCLDHSPVSSSFHGLHFPVLVCLYAFVFLTCLWRKERLRQVVLVFNKAQHQITLVDGPSSFIFCRETYIIRGKFMLLWNQEWFLVCTGARTYQWSSMKYLRDWRLRTRVIPVLHKQSWFQNLGFKVRNQTGLGIYKHWFTFLDVTQTNFFSNSTAQNRSYLLISAFPVCVGRLCLWSLHYKPNHLNKVISK